MIYYKFHFTFPHAEGKDERTREEHRADCLKIANKGRAFCTETMPRACLGVHDVDAGSATVIAALTPAALSEKSARAYGMDFLAKVFGEGELMRMAEISEDMFFDLFRQGSRSRYLENTEDFDHMGAGHDTLMDTTDGEEFLAAEVRGEAEALCCSDTFLPELARIEEGSARAFSGHPVHYILRTTDQSLTHKVTDHLVGALYDKGRLLSRRYTEISIYDRSICTRDVLRLYRRSAGTTVVLQLDPRGGDDNPYAEPDANLEEVLKLAAELSSEVLTILCFKKREGNRPEEIQIAAETMAFVEIEEDSLSLDAAKACLARRAVEKGMTSLAGLDEAAENITSPNVKNLNKAFAKWYDVYLRTCAYPAYGEIRLQAYAGKKTAGNAYEQLMGMIGLAEAKKVLGNALDYFKAQKVFADMDGFAGRPSMHMVFAGNPGTAKTTAARLFGRTLYDNGILSTGDFVEVGRSDLVGKYVGWTAKAVHHAFHEASGGVLFIDEAYSLVDDRSGSFGDEAINTIVQCMENMRDEVCVIFAGYPEEMEGFLARNPGLSSRIAFHVHFPDYAPDELLAIARHIAEGKKRAWSPAAEAQLLRRFQSAGKDRHFGNGRYVRNLVEQASMRQASRLLALGRDHVGPDDIRLLEAEDLAPEEADVRQAKVIGF